jgi:LemA protein
MTYIMIAIVALLLLVLAVILYNSLVRLRLEADEALSDIDVQLKRRYDLIPNLIETVKGYAKHEKGVFEEVTRARSQAEGTSLRADPQAAGKAEGMLSAALGNLIAVAENYPDLKASSNFLDLQRELSATEDKIAASRRYYNSVIRTYNTKTQQVPSSIVARLFRFGKREFFELADAEEREVVEVRF